MVRTCSVLFRQDQPVVVPFLVLFKHCLVFFCVEISLLTLPLVCCLTASDRGIFRLTELLDAHVRELVGAVVHLGDVLEFLEAESSAVPAEEFFVERVEICRFAGKIDMPFDAEKPHLVLPHQRQQLFP